ncbi:Amine oxidase, partial [Cynara cardunculus var. scolymus]
MAGLTAANKLYKSGVKKGAFKLCVVEGGNRIGGRINTSEFGGDKIKMGATWIHGIAENGHMDMITTNRQWHGSETA